ncbi:MAG: MerR family transcriptional regulator [Cryobacterium sp.]|nr:MerR family transcriptional regulator [Micrococcales bacterium]MBX3308998.1 MerR family transcriptional regulator [Cryobacterium sp.]
MSIGIAFITLTKQNFKREIGEFVTENLAAAKGVYGITVAAELAGAGEQALRLYERKGLLTPGRTAGGTRRYSDNDVTVLRKIVALLAEGVNLAGVRRVLELEAANAKLLRRISRMSN